MILTRKCLLVDIFSHSQLIKITRMLRVYERYVRALYIGKCRKVLWPYNSLLFSQAREAELTSVDSIGFVATM